MTPYPKTDHQEPDSQDCFLALEWPLATVPDIHPLQPCHGETPPPPLSQWLSSFPQLNPGALTT